MMRPQPVAPAREICLEHVSRVYREGSRRHAALDDISFRLTAGERMAVLGPNGAGKSTLVRLLGGIEQPSAGRIALSMSLSWPLTFVGGFEPELNGFDNIRLVARLYDRPIRETIDFVDDFAELGRHLRDPVRTYSSGMRARLAFALTLAIDFDCFLVDEVIAVGDRRFHQKCHDALFVQRAGAGMILVSHAFELVRDYCTSALVLKNGRGRRFDDVCYAFDIYASL